MNQYSEAQQRVLKLEVGGQLVVDAKVAAFLTPWITKYDFGVKRIEVLELAEGFDSVVRRGADRGAQ